MPPKRKNKNQNISKYFPATYGDKSYQQTIKDCLAKKTEIGTDNNKTQNELSDMSGKTEIEHLHRELQQITQDRNEYKRRCESQQKQIEVLTEHLTRLTRQNREYEVSLEKTISVDDKLYSNYGLTSTSIIEMRNINKNQKNDREFIRTTLKALYHSDPSKLKTKSMKGSNCTTKITPEKHEKLKNIFLERLNHITRKDQEINARFAKFHSLISRSIHDIKHRGEKTKNGAGSEDFLQDQTDISNMNSQNVFPVSPYFLLNADPISFQLL